MHATIEGRRLAYREAGRGAPVVLLHAFPFDGGFWDRTVDALAPWLRVIAVDLRGFGGSDLGSGPVSIAGMADDVVALLDVLALPRAFVCGVSMGGYVAQAMAVNHPQRLSGLVLADTRAAPDSPEAKAARGAAIALVRDEGVAAYVERQLGKLLARSASEPVRDEVRTLGGRQRPDAVVAGLEALRDRPDRRPDLPGLRVPTLVVVGSEDVISPPAEAAEIAAAIPGARLAAIAGAGHLANLEAPDLFHAALTPFLRSPPG